MTCDNVLERLDDYVDGELSEAEHQEVELHLASCESCRAEERALRAFLAEAATHKRERRPERDLWPDIAERIRSERQVLPFLKRAPAWLVPAGLAAAAAVIVTLTLRPAPPATVSGPGGTLQPVNQTGSGNDVEKAEAEYVRATTDLLAVLNARRGSLAPDQQKTLDENLGAIDQSLGEVKAALAKDPQNPKLTRMLASTHQKKLDLLFRLIKLTAQI